MAQGGGDHHQSGDLPRVGVIGKPTNSKSGPEWHQVVFMQARLVVPGQYLKQGKLQTRNGKQNGQTVTLRTRLLTGLAIIRWLSAVCRKIGHPPKTSDLT